MNEVPSPKGGLYWCGDAIDHRDHTRPIDSNAEQRDLIVKSIVERLTNAVVSLTELRNLVQGVLRELKIDKSEGELIEIICVELARSGRLVDQQAAGDAIKESDIKLITEYGRAVHGEMDAILTCARLGISVRGTYLYVTTFPCHNCTRHIVASGIDRVYYVEPYPKSKAKDLHSDAICFDEKDAKESGRIPFLPFVGIGPRRYLDFFSLDLSSGRPIKRKGEDNAPFVPPKLDRAPRVSLNPLSYLESEDKLLSEYTETLKELRGKRAPRQGA